MIDKAKAAGVYVFSGGTDENMLLISADDAVAEAGYLWEPHSKAAQSSSNDRRSTKRS